MVSLSTDHLWKLVVFDIAKYLKIQCIMWTMHYGHKNGIYCIVRNVTELVKFWMDKSKVAQYTYNKMRYVLVSVNIKLYKIENVT